MAMFSRRAACPRHLHMHQQIYRAVIGAMLVVMLAAIVVSYLIDDDGRHREAFSTFTSIVAQTLPPASASPALQRKVIADWVTRTRIQFALFTPDGQAITAPQRCMPAPQNVRHGGYFDDWRDSRFVWQLTDGRTLVVRFGNRRARQPWLYALLLLVVALTVAASTFPIVRRITRRLEDLQRSVEALGEGNLQARVDIHGDDEVGRVAQSFNRSAARIEALVRAQKTLLANASHEFRSPLARIQVASSLLGGEGNAATQEIAQSVRELDDLVGEILLASRLEMAETNVMPAFEMVDLTALVAEECARTQASLEADHVLMLGDSRLLRRLIRNLLENAHRHGGMSPVSVVLRNQPAQQFSLLVCDSGPGVPESERARVFEPFYRLAGSRERDGGVGLGLALVQTIARHHGGHAWCEGRDEGGACFGFSGPCQPPVSG